MAISWTQCAFITQWALLGTLLLVRETVNIVIAEDCVREGIVADPDDIQCRKYYVCEFVDGKYHVYGSICPLGYYIDVEEESCRVKPKKGTCGSGRPTLPPPTPPPPPPPSTTPPPPPPPKPTFPPATPRPPRPRPTTTTTPKPPRPRPPPPRPPPPPKLKDEWPCKDENDQAAEVVSYYYFCYWSDDESRYKRFKRKCPVFQCFSSALQRCTYYGVIEGCDTNKRPTSPPKNGGGVVDIFFNYTDTITPFDPFPFF